MIKPRRNMLCHRDKPNKIEWDLLSDYDGLLLSIENGEINVNGQFDNGEYLFNYILLLRNSYRTVMSSLSDEKYFKIIQTFIRKKELIVTKNNLESLYCHVMRNRSSNCPMKFEIIKYILNNTINPIRYQMMLSGMMEYAIITRSGCIIDYILDIPNYNMRLECSVRLLDCCVDSMNDDLGGWVFIMKKIMNHRTFINIYKSFVDWPYWASKYNEIKNLIDKYESSRLFILMTGHSDGYLEIDHRFFNITEQLPMEIQMIIANRAYKRSNNFIPICDIERNINII